MFGRSRGPPAALQHASRALLTLASDLIVVCDQRLRRHSTPDPGIVEGRRNYHAPPSLQRQAVAGRRRSPSRRPVNRVHHRAPTTPSSQRGSSSSSQGQSTRPTAPGCVCCSPTRALLRFSILFRSPCAVCLWLRRARVNPNHRSSSRSGETSEGNGV